MIIFVGATLGIRKIQNFPDKENSLFLRAPTCPFLLRHNARHARTGQDHINIQRKLHSADSPGKPHRVILPFVHIYQVIDYA